MSLKRRTNDTSSNNSSTSKRRNLSQVEISQNNTLPLPEVSLRCGKIKEIHLTNFMCHSNLLIKFNKRVNFVVGSNGSGKSAILAALVLGLGARASATNRSTSMKQFIKSGETSAKIEIVIWNEGPEAYEIEKYGDRITIIRAITQTSATYTIKNASGNVVTKKVDDLHRLLMYHNIQVDNPVFVLNQDSAREFLKDLEPKKNHKLFLKATQIEMIMETLNFCVHSHHDHKYQVQCLEEKIDQSKKEIEELEVRHSKLMSLENVKSMLVEKQKELLWAIVREQEEAVQKSCDSIKNVENKQNDIQKMIESKSQIEADCKSKMRQYEVTLQEKNALFSEGNKKLNELKSSVAEVNDRATHLNSVLRSQKNKKSLIEDDMKQLEQNITERSKTNMDAIEELRRKNSSDLNGFQKLKDELRAMIELTKRDCQMFVDNKLKTEEQRDELKLKQNDLNAQIRRIQSQIRNIKDSSKDKLSIYGQNMGQLVAEIEKCHRSGQFSEMPRGPLGRYIEVINASHRDVVESQIGAMLNAFVVSNKQDRFILEKILQKVCPNFHPTIITTRFMKKVYDVSRGMCRPPRGTLLLMDLIKCSDHVVMNCLIDRVAVETILFAESKEIAEHLTSNIQNVPHNLQRVILPNPGLEYYPEPNYRMYSMRIRPASYIQVNIQERINQLEQEVNEHTNRLEEYNLKINSIYPKLKADNNRIQEKRSLLESHEIACRELEEKISELENFEYPEYNELDVLRKELDENKNRHTRLNDLIEETKIDMIEIKNKYGCQEAELKNQKESIQQIENDINSIKSQYNSAKSQLNSILSSDAQSQLTEINENLKSLQREYKEKLKALNEKTTAAESQGDRVYPDQTKDELEDTIKQLQGKLKERSKGTEDILVLKSLIDEKMDALNKDESLRDSVKDSMAGLMNSRINRFRFISILKRHLAMVLQFTFDEILKVRKFSGAISVDNKACEVNVSVKPRDVHIQNAVSSVKSLSGGERSYSTIAFLMSLWACVDHPFFFLDEYDVFTDEVNREYITRLLLNEAKGNPQRQYSFLTPQDLSVESESFIQIHRLTEPKR